MSRPCSTRSSGYLSIFSNIILSVILSNFRDSSTMAVMQESVVLCDELFCFNVDVETPCRAGRNCTTQKYREYLSPQTCNCCPGTFCAEYIEENKPCDHDSQPPNVNICGPHLTCQMYQPYTCVPITNTECMKEVNNYQKSFADGTIATAQFLPQCTAVGAYSPKQCLPGSICFCTNSYGERIFGIGLHTTKMDCQCSRDIDMLTKVNLFTGKLPHCLPNGDYDELQCAGRSCWCRQTPQVQKPILQMNQLSCFDKDIHPMKPTPYLRDCDYAKAEIELEIMKSENETTFVLVADTPKCDPDGFYSPVQSQNHHLICVDHQGRQIENYKVDKKSPLASKMDCHCARIRQLMEHSVNGLPTCCQIGNFRKWQCTSSICYCVDRDGKQIISGSEPYEVPIDDVDLLICKQESTSDDDCAY